MNLEATVLTAVVTLVILAAASVVMVIRYNRAHRTEIRAALVNKAYRFGIAAPEDLSNHDLNMQIRAAKRQGKSKGMKAA